jgi:TonB family protein
MKRFRIVGVAALHAFACVLLSAGDEDEMGRMLADAEQGSAEAMIELAAAYHGGGGEPVDLEMAAHWLRKAADAGVPEAHVWLGEMHETGAGVPRDLEFARLCYETAATSAVPSANFRLGLMHFDGWGVPSDPNRAIAFFTRAAEADYVPAQSILAEILMFGVKVPKDPAAGLRWAERASEKEDAKAIMAVGNAYFSGIGVKRDLRKARQWYHEASEGERIGAMLRVAQTYAMDSKTPENFYQMKRWLALAAKAGSDYATVILASVAENLREPDAELKVQAREYLRTTAESGGQFSIEVLKLEQRGMSLRDALAYVMLVPNEKRYAHNYNATLSAQGDRPPRIVHNPQPKFPEGMVLTQTEGSVVVRFVITEKGTVEGLHVVSSSHPGFEANAIEAVSRWRFSPGIKHGVPVAVNIELPISFSFKQ